MIKIGLLNGPNLDRLGIREPKIYGSTSLAQIEQSVTESAQNLDSIVECFQSNHEGALIDKIHNWSDEEFYGMIFNPGGFTHTKPADGKHGTGKVNLKLPVTNVYYIMTYVHQSSTTRS